MSMRGIKNQNIRTGRQKLLGASNALFANSDGRAHAQTALGILAGIGIFLNLVDILHCNQADKAVIVVNHKQFFNSVFMQVAF
jgi:hypothetical protein